MVDTKAGFVIVDALVDVMPGKDENDPQHVQPIFMGLRDIAEQTRAAIVVIHHFNKSGGYRGSTAIEAAADLMLGVRKSGNTQTFTSTKARDTDAVGFSALMNFGEGIFNLSPIHTSGPSEEFPQSERYVLRYLSEHGPSLTAAIVSQPDGCSGDRARQAIHTLKDKSLVQRIDPGGPGTKATYDLTDLGKKAANENL